MGAFDDLIPADTIKAPTGSFDDLVPQDRLTAETGAFSDLIPPAARASQADVRRTEPEGLWDVIVENVGGSLVRGTEALQRELAMLKLLHNARELDIHNAAERGENLKDFNLPTIRAAEYRGYSVERRNADRTAAEANLVKAITEIAERSKTLAGMPVDPDVSKALNAETIEEFWEGFKKKPLKFIANVGLESLPQMLPGIAAAIPAGLIAGPLGAAVAIGAGSGVVDYAASTMEALARRKVDLTDESAIRRAVADPAMLEEVKIAAFKHAAPVAIFDAASVNALASRLGRTFVTNMLKQLGVQATLGAGGEAIGQVAAQEGYQPGQVVAEAAGELAQAPFEAATAGAFKAVQPSEATRRAQVVAQELDQAVAATDLTAGTEQVAVDLLSPERVQYEAVEISTPLPAAAQQAVSEPPASAEAAPTPLPAVEAAPGEAPAAAAIPEPQPTVARATEAVAAPEAVPAPQELEDIPEDLIIRQPVLVEETGETVQVKRNAREAFMEADQKVNRYKALIDCIGRDAA